MRLTDTQRAILVALCRPRADGNRYATPATNQEIAAEVFLSVDAVKAHLRALYRKFGVEPLPHNQKRARLVELVMEGELISLPAGRRRGDSPADAQPGPQPSPPSTAGRPRPPGGDGRAAAGSALAAALARRRRPRPGPHRGPLLGLLRRLREGGQHPGRLPGGGQRLLPPRPRGQARSSGGLDSRTRAGVPRRDRDDERPSRIAHPAPGTTTTWRCFASGLERAADYTTVVAQGPPPPGSREGANVVAQLTLAAGQVQAGALGYGLGRRLLGDRQPGGRAARPATRPSPPERKGAGPRGPAPFAAIGAEVASGADLAVVVGGLRHADPDPLAVACESRPCRRRSPRRARRRS